MLNQIFSRPTLAVSGVAAMIIGALAAAPADAISREPAEARPESSRVGFDRETECNDLAPPQKVSAAHVTEDNIIEFDVHVLLDRVTIARGKVVFETVRDIYSEIDVDLRYSLRRVDLVVDEEPHTYQMINSSRAYLGGAVPERAEAVYTLSGRDFAGAEVGQASCVGGIEFPDEAFAVGRDYGPNETDENELVAGLSTLRDGSARVAAHEIGHLLGAHHHYASCTEPEGMVEGHASPCSLMGPHLRLQNTHFGPFDGAVARGYAELFLAD